jgi:hypothetical protein
MSSKVDIANQALTMLGADRIISFGDDSTEANVMSTVYEPTKRAFLRSYHWNCASRRARLALLAEEPENEYQYAFALPEDNLRILKVYRGDRIARRQWDEYSEFRVEGKKLLANSTNIFVLYIMDIVESEFDPHCEMAFVAKLAAEAAYPLQGSPGNQTNLIQIAELKMVEARTTDNLESGTEVFRTDRLDIVRL